MPLSNLQSQHLPFHQLTPPYLRSCLSIPYRICPHHASNLWEALGEVHAGARQFHSLGYNPTLYIIKAHETERTDHLNIILNNNTRKCTWGKPNANFWAHMNRTARVAGQCLYYNSKHTYHCVRIIAYCLCYFVREDHNHRNYVKQKNARGRQHDCWFGIDIGR